MCDNLSDKNELINHRQHQKLRRDQISENRLVCGFKAAFKTALGHCAQFIDYFFVWVVDIQVPRYEQ